MGATVAATTVEGVTKRFGPVTAVDNLSFEIKAGEILGFLGPNGAGKTTMMRMILDLIRPDAGTIQVFGQPPSYRLGSRIGYLPEERGLYRDIPIVDSVAYLAALKGMASRRARSRAEELLREVGLGESMAKKASELSRGMHQKAQVIASILHDPDLLIMDEPSQGLDPLNADLLRSLILQRRDAGAAVVFSTHRMEEAEDICDRILLINRGQRLLYGKLGEIRRSLRERAVVAGGKGLPKTAAGLAGVASPSQVNGDVRYVLNDGRAPGDLFRVLAASDAQVDHFEVVTPSLEEIFIRTVEAASGKEAVR